MLQCAGWLVNVIASKNKYVNASRIPPRPKRRPAPGGSKTVLPTTLWPVCMSNTRADHPREAANLANVSPQTYRKGATHSPDSPLPSLWDVHFRRPCSDRCCTCRKSPLSGLPAGQPNRASEPSVWAILRPFSGCGYTCRKIALERPPRRPAEKGLRILSLGHSEAVFRLRLHLPENRS